MRLVIWGCYVYFGWNWVDDAVEAIQARGLRAVVMVGGLPREPGTLQPGKDPCGSSGGYNANRPPFIEQDWDVWSDFVREAFNHTWEVADAIEVWNEPNLSQFWGGWIVGPGYGGTTYRQLFVRAFNAVAAGKQDLCAQGHCGLNLRVITAGMGAPRMQNCPGTTTIACPHEYLESFLQAMKNANQQAMVEGIGLHLYPGTSTHQTVSAQINRMQDAMPSGFATVPRYVTEYGIRTCGETPTVTESVQASRMLSDWNHLSNPQNYPNMHSVLFYRLYDDRHSCIGAGSSDPWERFGVMREDASPKLAYCELAKKWGGNPPRCPKLTQPIKPVSDIFNQWNLLFGAPSAAQALREHDGTYYITASAPATATVSLGSYDLAANKQVAFHPRAPSATTKVSWIGSVPPGSTQQQQQQNKVEVELLRGTTLQGATQGYKNVNWTWQSFTRPLVLDDIRLRFRRTQHLPGAVSILSAAHVQQEVYGGADVLPGSDVPGSAIPWTVVPAGSSAAQVLSPTASGGIHSGTVGSATEVSFDTDLLDGQHGPWENWGQVWIKAGGLFTQVSDVKIEVMGAGIHRTKTFGGGMLNDDGDPWIVWAPITIPLPLDEGPIEDLRVRLTLTKHTGPIDVAIESVFLRLFPRLTTQ